jgi:hypothetical protein
VGTQRSGLGSAFARAAAIAVVAAGLVACGGNAVDTGVQITPPVPNSPAAGEIPDKTHRATATIVDGKLSPERFGDQIGTAFVLTVTGDGKEHTLKIDELVDGKTIAPTGDTNVTFTIEGEPGDLDILLDGKKAGTFERQAASGASNG